MVYNSFEKIQAKNNIFLAFSEKQQRINNSHA
jgi:hypothetical protein